MFYFLKKGVKKVQLTFFELEDMTDKYIKAAFQELLQATEILLQHEIAPRWQVFINEENKEEIVQLLELIPSLDLDNRCKSFGSEFNFFVHAGSCDGENRKLYPIRINQENVPGKHRYSDRFVLQISNQMDVYFDYTHLLEKWKIGNIREISSEEMMRRILDEDVEALKLSKEITLSELIKQYGDFNFHKLFEKEDDIQYLLNKHIEEKTRNNGEKE